MTSNPWGDLYSGGVLTPLQVFCIVNQALSLSGQDYWYLYSQSTLLTAGYLSLSQWPRPLLLVLGGGVLV